MDNFQYRITRVQGYGDSDGQSETHALSWFTEERGFNPYEQDAIGALSVAQTFVSGGTLDKVEITRLALVPPAEASA